jgi:hypothetical protein
MQRGMKKVLYLCMYSHLNRVKSGDEDMCLPSVCFHQLLFGWLVSRIKQKMRRHAPPDTGATDTMQL